MITTMKAALAAAMLSGVLAGAAGAQPEETVYLGVHVIDTRDGTIRRDQALTVSGERIAAIEPAEGFAVAEGAGTVDAAGLYVIAGLIDAHVHIATPPDRARAERLLRRHVYAGVTAVRVMADDLRSVGELARAARVGEIDAPDIHYAALVAGPSFFADPRTHAVTRGAEPGRVPWMQAIDDETDLALAVAMARGTFASGLKIYANLPGALVAALTEEAHRQGFPVWAHAMVFPATPEEVIAAGPDVMSHVCYLAYQAMETRPDSHQGRFPVDETLFETGDNPVMQTLFEAMAARGIVLDASMRVYREAERRYEMGAGSEPHCSSELAGRLTGQALRAGVEVAAGTDGAAHPANPWPALYDELEMLRDLAGFTNDEVLRAATHAGARALGLEDEMGAVEPGKLANLVFLQADPRADLAALRDIAFTLKRGARLDRDAYAPDAE